jgi:SnoaL-like domain
VKGMVYLLIILLIGAIGGYLGGQKIDEWRATKTTAQGVSQKPEDFTATLQELLDREKTAYQNHDADQLLNDCVSDYAEINGNTGESMDLARARLYYHQYFKEGQAVNFTVDNLQLTPSPNALVAQASYKKISNAFTSRNIHGYKGRGTWVFVRQNSIWRLASFAWAEESF